MNSGPQRGAFIHWYLWYLMGKNSGVAVQGFTKAKGTGLSRKGDRVVAEVEGHELTMIFAF